MRHKAAVMSAGNYAMSVVWKRQACGWKQNKLLRQQQVWARHKLSPANNIRRTNIGQTCSCSQLKTRKQAAPATLSTNKKQLQYFIPHQQAGVYVAIAWTAQQNQAQ